VGGGSSGTGGSTGSGGAAPSPDAGAAGRGGPVPTFPPPVGTPVGAGATFVVVSGDGGATFSAPRNIGVSQSGEAHIAAGGSGVAYVLSQGALGLAFTRTNDSGRTWSTPQVLSAQGGGNLRLAAAGKRVVVTATGMAGAVLWHSDDGGRTFALTNIDNIGFVFRSFVEPGTGAVWLFTLSNGTQLWKSTDGGATFPSSTPLALDFGIDVVGFGKKTLFGVGKEPRLAVLSLDEPAKVRFVDGLSMSPRFSRELVVDRCEAVTVIDSGPEGLQALRLDPGATAFGLARPLGSSDGPVSAAALSPHAVALASSVAGQVMVSVQVWP
jgi:hypothetical protein